jgi:hypothetical protein
MEKSSARLKKRHDKFISFLPRFSISVFCFPSSVFQIRSDSGLFACGLGNTVLPSVVAIVKVVVVAVAGGGEVVEDDAAGAASEVCQELDGALARAARGFAGAEYEAHRVAGAGDGEGVADGEHERGVDDDPVVFRPW